jgi:excisionase family DNA binding protein
MITNSILLENLSVEQLQKMIDTSIKLGIENQQKELQTKFNTEELLSRNEAIKLLKIDASTIYAWCNAGKIKCYGIGARRYFKKSEIMESLTLLKKK